MADSVVFLSLSEHKPIGQRQVTTPSPHVTLSINLNTERLKKQLIYHHIFRVLRPFRKKHSISSNDILVLNGIHIYTLCVKVDFTLTSIINFVKYYNAQRMKFYFDNLIRHNLIRLHRQAGAHTYYRITEEGYNLINELFNEYDAIHAKFINQFNISL